MAVEVESVEDVDDLLAPTDESVELPENVHFREFKLTFVRHLLQLPLRLVEALLILLREVKGEERIENDENLVLDD